jgi:hypothetical protein
MFIAELFTISKLWKQPRCSQLMNGLKKCVYIHHMVYVNGILFSHKEE